MGALMELKEVLVNISEPPAQDVAERLVERRFKESILGLMVPSFPEPFNFDTQGATHTEADNTSSGITFEDIEQAVTLLKSHGPFATRIWFVDAPHWYQQFLSIVERGDAPQHGGIAYSAGIEILTFERRDLHRYRGVIELPPDVEGPLQDADVVYPWVCAIPGIWAEMSDRTYKYLSAQTLTLIHAHKGGWSV